MLEGLLGMMTEDEQDVRTIQYRINGVTVCKDFYRAAVGGDVKMFNSCVAYLTGKSNLRSSVCGRAIGEGQRVEQSNPSLTTAMREDAEICGTSNALKQPSSAVCMYVCLYACMHVCMYACMHVCMNVYHDLVDDNNTIRNDTCIHACIYPYTHIYIHTCILAHIHT
jgi:hypothetical protein